MNDHPKHKEYPEQPNPTHGQQQVHRPLIVQFDLSLPGILDSIKSTDDNDQGNYGNTNRAKQIAYGLSHPGKIQPTQANQQS